MKTSLHFEAPSDLSVGTVRISTEGKTVAEWVATPDTRIFEESNLSPGIYSAEIGPAGVAPQSVVFQVKEGQANTVVLPTFTALLSSGSNTNFFDVDSNRTVSEFPHFMGANTVRLETVPQARTGLNDDSSRTFHRVEFSGDTRRMSIGLSEEKSSGRNSFSVFRGKSRIELLGGRIEVNIPTDFPRERPFDRRVRLSAAIERLRVERCFLPLYRGGTTITIAPPPFSPSDLELIIMPVEPKLRALVRTLDAGTSADARAVCDDVLAKSDLIALLFKDNGDPWAAILYGLLAIRFPEVFDPINPAWVAEFVRQTAWAFDSHVIAASQTLSAMTDETVDAQHHAVKTAIAHLAKAQSAGSPYYKYTNQLFSEMIGGIASYLSAHRPVIDASSVKTFDRLHSRWQRELVLQRGAGPTFTWLARDQVALRDRNVLVPSRNSSGRLRPKDTWIVFEGQISAGQISVIGGVRNSSQLPTNESNISPDIVEQTLENDPKDYPSSMPALLRPAGPKYDPNRGRFGGQKKVGGFDLVATFTPTKSSKWVNINLAVEADQSAEVDMGDSAWFVLHPTFSPTMLKVMFRGRRARLHIQAWAVLLLVFGYPEPALSSNAVWQKSKTLQAS